MNHQSSWSHAALCHILVMEIRGNPAGPYDLSRNPVHLGLNAMATVEPVFDGDPGWYLNYGERHLVDGVEGRLVAIHSFDGPWDSWEVHPSGHEVVVCIAGELELVQLIDGAESTVRLEVGEYAINEPGVWHTANTAGRCEALFITAGAGTEHRPR